MPRHFFDEITKQLDLAMRHLPLCHFGNRSAGQECAHKNRTIPDRWTDNFAETGQFFDELSALKRTRIDAIGHDDQIGMSMPIDANRIDDFKRSDRGLKVQSRGRAWHEDQTGDPSQGAESLLAGRGIDNDVTIICSDPDELTIPVIDVLTGKSDLVDGKLQVAWALPTGRPNVEDRRRSERPSCHAWWSSAATETASVVLPTPPLGCATAIV